MGKPCLAQSKILQQGNWLEMLLYLWKRAQCFRYAAELSFNGLCIRNCLQIRAVECLDPASNMVAFNEFYVENRDLDSTIPWTIYMLNTNCCKEFEFNTFVIAHTQR